MAQLKLMSLPILLLATFSAALIMAGEARKPFLNLENDIIIHRLGQQQHGSEGAVINRKEDGDLHRSPPFSASHRGTLELEAHRNRKDSTSPGHSPGVGHLMVSNAAQIPPDFQPTMPGYCPSSGRSVDKP